MSSGGDIDFIKIAKDPKVLKVLQTKGHNFPNREELLLSAIVTKINRKNKEQTRVLVITNKAVYNLLRGSYTCKRRIPIQALGLVTDSSSSDEFVLHVPSEYDYRYKSDKKKTIITLLTKLFKQYTSQHDVQRKRLITIKKPEKQLGIYAITKQTRDREQILKMRMAMISEISKDDSDVEENGSKRDTTNMLGTEKVSTADFELLKVLGRGSFGKVMQVRHKSDGNVYAMKILKKKAIVKRDQVDHTKSEREILQAMQHPFLMKLRFAFQTKQKLYFVLDFLRGGELFFHLKSHKFFSIDIAKMYVAEIGLALGHLHSLGYIYRDLKPENILLDDDGHVCLTDFGLSTKLQDDGKATTFCGTPEYLAPEIITAVGHDRMVDWWSLGILLYELTVGIPPFYSQNVHEMYQSIQFAPIKFPQRLPEDCKDIILQLLTRDPQFRMGAKRDVEEIKEHKFYNDVNWEKLYARGYTPRFKPTVKNDTYTGNFDKEFTDERVQDTPAGPASALAPEEEKAFDGFTFDPNKGGGIIN